MSELYHETRKPSVEREGWYDLEIKVISQKGTCEHGHKVGDTWVMNRWTPEGICASAFVCFYPNARALMFGAPMPFSHGPYSDTEDASAVTTVACPDPRNPVVFQLRRLPK